MIKHETEPFLHHVPCSPENAMLGVVLCGGKSTRMGKDKGLLTTHHVTWAQLTRNKLATLELPSVLSVNPGQVAPYERHFPGDELVVDATDMDLGGPLLGLFSVHRKFPAQDLFALACDLQKMQTEVLIDLRTAYEDKKNAFGAFVYRNENRIEPLCGIYTATGLDALITLFRERQLTKHSMMHALENLATCYLTLPPDRTSSFQNMNTPADLTKK